MRWYMRKTRAGKSLVVSSNLPRPGLSSSQFWKVKTTPPSLVHVLPMRIWIVHHHKLGTGFAPEKNGFVVTVALELPLRQEGISG